MRTLSIFFFTLLFALLTSVSCNNQANVNSSQQSTEQNDSSEIAAPTAEAVKVMEENGEMDFHEGERTEAELEISKWLKEYVRINEIPEHMKNHNLTLSSQQMNDIKVKSDEALEQLVYWIDVRGEELAKQIEEAKASNNQHLLKQCEDEVQSNKEIMEIIEKMWKK